MPVRENAIFPFVLGCVCLLYGLFILVWPKLGIRDRQIRPECVPFYGRWSGVCLLLESAVLFWAWFTAKQGTFYDTIRTPVGAALLLIAILIPALLHFFLRRSCRKPKE